VVLVYAGRQLVEGDTIHGDRSSATALMRDIMGSGRKGGLMIQQRVGLGLYRTAYGSDPRSSPGSDSDAWSH
jgi:hypothetical protein